MCVCLCFILHIMSGQTDLWTDIETRRSQYFAPHRVTMRIEMTHMQVSPSGCDGLGHCRSTACTNVKRTPGSPRHILSPSNTGHKDSFDTHHCNTVRVRQRQLIFFMATLRSRRGHYIFILWFPHLSFSPPILRRRRLDVCHTSTHGVDIMRIYDAAMKRAACGSP